MEAFENSLVPLEEIPLLLNRVTVVEDDVAALKTEQADMRDKLSKLLASGTGAGYFSATPTATSAQDTEAIQQLRESNAKIQARLNNVATAQSKLTAELVITGMATLRQHP